MFKARVGFAFNRRAALLVALLSWSKLESSIDFGNYDNVFIIQTVNMLKEALLCFYSSKSSFHSFGKVDLTRVMKSYNADKVVLHLQL